MATTKTRPTPAPVDHIHAAARENAQRENGHGDDPSDAKEAAEPLLKLSTVLEPRPAIEIDNTMYELRHRREFSIVEQHALQVEGDEFDTLWDRKEALNNRQRQRLKTVLDAMFDKVLIAPPEVAAKLDDESRRSVVLTFTRAPLLMAQMQDLEKRLTEDDEEEESLPISDT